MLQSVGLIWRCWVWRGLGVKGWVQSGLWIQRKSTVDSLFILTLFTVFVFVLFIFPAEHNYYYPEHKLKEINHFSDPLENFINIFIPPPVETTPIFPLKPTICTFIKFNTQHKKFFFYFQSKYYSSFLFRKYTYIYLNYILYLYVYVGCFYFSMKFFFFLLFLLLE